jgi:hypothetical protein
MDEKEQLVQELDEARQAIRALVASINTDKEIYPTWTLKQFLAHITGWDDATTTSLRAHATGKEPGTPAYRGIDFYNAETVSTREGLDYRHVVAEWELAREQLKATIRAMPDDKFNETLVYPWGPTGSVMRLVRIMIHHEHEHAEEIRKLFGEQSAPPAQPPSPSQTAQS